MGNSGQPRDRFSCFRVCETEQCTFLFCIDVKVVLSPPPPPPTETQILRLGLSSPLIHMGSLGFLARPPRILNRERQFPWEIAAMFQHRFSQLRLNPTEREDWRTEP